MARPRRGALRWAALLSALATVLLVAPATAAPAPVWRGGAADNAAAFVVDGAVDRPLTLTVEDLRENFTAQRERVQFESSQGKQNGSYRGPLLIDVLNAAEPQFNPEERNDPALFAILVTATDGFQTVVSWGEIDPRYAGNDILLAFEEDREALDRPRLVVPGDVMGARYVTDITRVTLIRIGGAKKAGRRVGLAPPTGFPAGGSEHDRT